MKKTSQITLLTVKNISISIGYEYPVKPTKYGILYVNGLEFANIWYNTEKHIPANQWTLNRSTLALDMGLPVCDTFETREQLLQTVSEWFDQLPEEVINKYIKSIS